MAPQDRRKSRRGKPLFNLKEIAFYGLPFWVGAIIAGWYFGGLIGLRSAVVGLLLLGIYAGSEAGFARLANRFQSKSPAKVVGVAVAGFWIRLIGLWVLAYVLSKLMQLNLLIILMIIAFGFTVVLAISAKNWLKD